MKRRFLILCSTVLLLILTGCGLLPIGEEPVSSTAEHSSLTDILSAGKPSTAGPVTSTPVPDTATPPPTITSTPIPPTVTLPPPATATSAPADLAVSPGGVFIYPVPAVYAGDSVTVQVLASVPTNINPAEVAVQLLIDDVSIANGTLNGRNLGGDAVGLFAWVWESDPGDHQLSVILDPQDAIVIGDENPNNNRADLSVPVQPQSALPPDEQGAVWITAETEYANIHAVSGTAAARDLALLQEATDRAAEQAIDRLQEQPQQKFEVYFIDRVLGQGGYAGSSMVVSYLDRDYAGGGLHEVLVHEMIHLLDQQFTQHRVPFLVEGVAVWASDGHYKPENLDHRMAALREIGLYVPIAELIDDFYPAQHEIGYLQGAGFVKYLVDSYGWPAVREFYTGINPDEAGMPSQMIDQALQRHFNKSLEEFEGEWTAYLDRIPYGPEAEIDLATTLRYYDTMRRYQLQYDPTAHFLQAWLPFPQELETRNITADLTRHPETEVNVALETMLQSVNSALMTGNYNRANAILDSVGRVLASQGLFVDPIAAHHLEIVRSLSALGYEVQAIEVIGNQALVLAHSGSNTDLSEVNLVLRNRGWVVTN